MKNRENWPKMTEIWAKLLIIDEKVYTNDEIYWVIDRKSWSDWVFTQKLAILLTLSQIVRYLDDFWLNEWWQVMTRSCWETCHNDISTLISTKQAPKTLILRAVLSKIVTLPKRCRFQERSKTTSRTIQRLLTIIIVTSYDHHQGQKPQIT